MTEDKLPPLSTPIVLPSQPSFTLPIATAPQYAVRKQEVEEEPYTIKCICGFADDDGYTIYCEKCDTWQHIECYYPNQVDDAVRDDFAHSCVECQPRVLAVQQAIQRQKARTTALPVAEAEATDRKPKRPPPKSHKKKPKPTDLQLNGNAHPTDHAKHAPPHEPNTLPPKKPKNSHKPTPSISSQAPKRSPSHGNPKGNHGHPPSPATTPPDLPDDFEMHNYSSGFFSVYSGKPYQKVDVNSFASLSVSNTMSDWLQDPDKLKTETGHTFDAVFQSLPPDIDSIKITPEVERTKRLLSPEHTVQWQCLRAPSPIGKDVPLMELNGHIGFQSAYCQDSRNRWDEFTSPLPMVVFHPSLPIYIDTRREGSDARFVRRSCKPNAVLETYLSETQYHFWLVSDRQIAAKEQITIPWDFRLPKNARILRILGFGDEDAVSQPELTVDETEYQRIASWVHLVLSEFGGCACNVKADCAFARFHRNYHAKAHARASAPKSKKRKSKAINTISPTSTGHATNSRAPSEGHLDDAPDHDRRSVSDSSRGKPESRDMTPAARQGSFDQLGILTEPTDRDKRKVAMVEDSFRRMEQQQEQKSHPPRKRKRMSDGTTTSKAKSTKSNSAAQTPTLPIGEFPSRHYVDAGTSRSKSGSPTSAGSPHDGAPRAIGLGIDTISVSARRVSICPQPDYRDASVQTDIEPVAAASPGGSVPVETPRRRVASLAHRLISHRRASLLADAEHRKRQSAESETPPVAMDIDSPVETMTPSLSPTQAKVFEKPILPDAAPPADSDDTPMPDAPDAEPKLNGTTPLLAKALKIKSPDLRVLMPPVPAFGTPSPSVLSATTPHSAGASLVQSPYSATTASPFGGSVLNGIAVNPSPVKKKLSLSDYTKSRMNKGAAGRPSVGTTSLKPMSNSEDPKSATSVELDSPTVEKINETTNSTATSATAAATAANDVL